MVHMQSMQRADETGMLDGNPMQSIPRPPDPGMTQAQTLTVDEAFKRAVQFHGAGRLQEAVQLYQHILAVAPGLPDVLNNLSAALRDMGDHHSAVDAARQAVAARPGFHDACNNLGLAHLDLGQLAWASAAFEEALAMQPDFFEARCNLALCAFRAGNLSAAEAHGRKALAMQPESPLPLHNLGNTLLATDRHEEAGHCFEKALERASNHPDLHNDYSNLLHKTGALKAALRHAERALALRPHFAGAHNNLAAIHIKNNRTDLALPHLRQAIALDPHLAMAHSNLGNILRTLGRHEEALAHYRASLASGVDLPRVKNLLNLLLYMPDVAPEEAFKMRCETLRAILPGADLPPLISPNAQPPRTENGQLRIGYLSSDLYDHPVGRNLRLLLTHHDKRRFEIFLYAEGGYDDALQAELKQHADHWQPIKGLEDQQVAAQIHRDGIHIMVYLAGHFDENRPQIAAYRPAPLQVSFHNGATTGLDEMDYWLTDAILHPPEATLERFTEQLHRLPIFYSYPPLDQAPEIRPPPAEKHGHTTYISLNDPAKISDGVIDLWARILRADDEARLLLKYRRAWQDPSIRARLVARMQAAGIHETRLDFHAVQDEDRQHLDLYNRADIALDPFPFTGATTTFQALWMGVPVVTLLGKSFIGRMAGSILIHAGLPELAVVNEDAYLEMALALSRDRARLKNLRGTLRRRLTQSPLCDGKRYATAVEAAYETMWQA